MTPQLRIFSSGGGKQSIAALVLSAQGKIDFPIHVFCNVGDDSENPDTLRYVEEYAKPYAEDNNIAFHEIIKKKGRKPARGVADERPQETVYSRAMADNKTIGIPVFMPGSGAPSRRNCTVDFKIMQVNRVARELGATDTNPAMIGIGISLDEFQRMSSDDPDRLYVRKVYPLIDLRLTRADCENIIRRAGLPVPPKSSCYFCPFHSMATWHELKNKQPELFDKAVEMEQTLNKKRAKIGKDSVWLTRKMRPLDQVVGDQSDMFDDIDDACESGFCMV